MEIKIVTTDIMRYPGCGDYFEVNGVMNIVVYDQQDDKKNLCIIVHELLEAYLTKWRGITEQSITDFDIEYEKNRREPESEPGDAPDAPYKKEHRFSENIERLLAFELGLDWKEYNENLKVYNGFNIE